jgi:hypothetical protein
MKLQLFFAPALLLAVVFDLAVRPAMPASIVVAAVFLVSTLPFVVRAIAKNFVVGMVSPALLALRSCAQLLGVTAGVIHAFRKSAEVPAKSPA